MTGTVWPTFHFASGTAGTSPCRILLTAGFDGGAILKYDVGTTIAREELHLESGLLSTRFRQLVWDLRTTGCLADAIWTGYHG